MLFNSFAFIVFATVFFLLWPVARPRRQLRWGYLILFSSVFYGWWDWRFLFLILASGLIDYTAALMMQKYERRKRLLLVVSVCGNLLSLAAFKYLGFITTNLNSLLSTFGTGTSIPLLELTLPVGISFYTFQSMSYTIDVYRGALKPTRNILHFFAYLAMFPQLVAGPIIRASALLPQLEKSPPTGESGRWEGLKLIVHGYFKKVVIADNLAPVVNAAFGSTTPVESGLYWWIVISMFAAQIYCDFSGYSDIARGLARWMGYSFAKNFDHPYTATSFSDFWRRWHMSLSFWFRDYVFIPLGGSRVRPTLVHRNIWLTMCLSGLWHGASWNFVIWGALHSAYMSLERLTNWHERCGRLPGGRWLSNLWVLLWVWVAWVFFRSETLAQSTQILRIMFDIGSINIAAVKEHLQAADLLVLGIVPLREMFVATRLGERRSFASAAFRFGEPVVLALMIAACIFLRGPGSAFIYFQF